MLTLSYKRFYEQADYISLLQDNRVNLSYLNVAGILVYVTTISFIVILVAMTTVLLKKAWGF